MIETLSRHMGKTMRISRKPTDPTAQDSCVGGGLKRHERNDSPRPISGLARGLRLGVATSFALISMAAAGAGAQSAKDSAAYARAQEMVANGDAANGRKLADSVANGATPGSAAYAEGLFWRATLAANARDSEHEYRQIIVDYPLSGRVPDALLRIGQLEAARGENAAALQHFQRLVLEHPLSPLRADGNYWIARMYFEGNDASRGCAANAQALASVSSANVELRNRIDFQQQRCRGVVLAADNSAAATPKSAPAPAKVAATKVADQKPRAEAREPVRPTRAETTATAAKVAEPRAELPAGSSSGVVNRQPTKEEVARALASAKLKVSPTAAASIEKKSNAPESADASISAKDSATPEAAPPAKSPARSPAKSSAKPSANAAGHYAVQLAAFGSKSAAVVLVNKLNARGYETYIDGSSAPYRVRLGHFSTRAAAAAELARLKAKHIDGFVVER
jgi:TolA-binding protein